MRTKIAALPPLTGLSDMGMAWPAAFFGTRIGERDVDGKVKQAKGADKGADQPGRTTASSIKDEEEKRDGTQCFEDTINACVQGRVLDSNRDKDGWGIVVHRQGTTPGHEEEDDTGEGGAVGHGWLAQLLGSSTEVSTDTALIAGNASLVGHDSLNHSHLLENVGVGGRQVA